MKIGFMGLGKLGLPVALAIESMGHKVKGYDINPKIKKYLEKKTIPYQEKGVDKLLRHTELKLVDSLKDLLDSELLFTAVQTPHEPQYEGITKLPDTRADFDYSYLISAISDIAEAAEKAKTKVTLVVVSTVLPGTFEKYLKPLLNEYTEYIYSPLYIAMGTVVDDYLNPEFSLIGGESEELESFYKTIHSKPIFKTDITTAEGIKVFYNTFITAKTLLANSWMQMSHKLGMNVDDITKALSLATDRLLSPKYMRGGGPDSGGCHPRDLIALSWLGKEIDLWPNWFEMMALTREAQTEWTVDLILEYYEKTQLPIVILGKTFKPETNLIVGSGAILLANMLKEHSIPFYHYDPYVDKALLQLKPALYFIATEHEIFNQYRYPRGSVILDLWGSIKKQPNVDIIGIGRIKSN